MNNIKKISIVSVFILSIFSTFAFVQAQTKLDAPTGPGTSEKSPLINCGNGIDQKECGAKDLFILLQSGLNLAFIFSGFIAASMFMYAGFLLITAVGNTGQIQKAKDIFRRVVIGFLIMFLAYIMVRSLLTNISAQQFFINLIK